MEPTKPFTQTGLPTQFPTPDDMKALNNFFSTLNLNELVSTSESSSAPNRVQERRFTYTGPNNNNNNNIPDPATEAEQEAADLEIIGEMDEKCDGFFDEFIKEFKKNPWLIELPSDITGNTPLLSAVMLFKTRPMSQDSLIECMAALLALGAKKDVVNFRGVSPLSAALDTKNEFLKELFTSEAAPTKQFLLDLAKKHKRLDLQASLELSPLARRFRIASRDFLDTIKNDKTNLYQRVFAFYQRFREYVREKNLTTQNTILHDAVTSYTSGHTLGIIEIVVLLEMGG